MLLFVRTLFAICYNRGPTIRARESKEEVARDKRLLVSTTCHYEF